MKARLLVEISKHPGYVPGTGLVKPIHPIVWPDDEEVPDGWEEIESVAEHPCRCSKLVGPEAADPCGRGHCRHSRKDHTSHRSKCLAPDCLCLRFEEMR